MPVSISGHITAAARIGTRLCDLSGSSLVRGRAAGSHRDYHYYPLLVACVQSRARGAYHQGLSQVSSRTRNAASL